MTDPSTDRSGTRWTHATHRHAVEAIVGDETTDRSPLDAAVGTVVEANPAARTGLGLEVSVVVVDKRASTFGKPLDVAVRVIEPRRRLVGHIMPVGDRAARLGGGRESWAAYCHIHLRNRTRPP